jgi:hypothetical protein
MLSLALLSYRGFWDPSSDGEDELADAITDGLAHMEPLRDDWNLVWGPGTYRYLGSVFDDAMMYVAQHRKHPERYAIVVRGTNPVALFDWLFGDFLAYRQLPWRPGGRTVVRDARLSLSTALGLKILLNMRGQVSTALTPEPGPYDFLFGLGADALDNAQNLKTSIANRLWYRQARQLIEQLLWYQHLWGFADRMAEDVTSQFRSALSPRDAQYIDGIRRRLLKLVDTVMDALGDAVLDLLVPVLQEQVNRPARNHRGIGLLDLLRALADRHGDALELFVTGHSKGGALAPALALCLADTQGSDGIPAAYRWNPDGKATIHCYAFAGPTPGNTAFAAHFNQRLGRRFYRYTNELDIVTGAWTPKGLRAVPNVYGKAVRRVPGLELLARAVAEDVEHLDYRHLGLNYTDGDGQDTRIDEHVIEFSGPLRRHIKSFFLQEIYQHVQAYIDALGLKGVIDITDLLGGDDESRSIFAAAS